MATFLSIALLVIGTSATLAAFGGKTWREGTEPILERVTVRGWISLICLILAFGVGIAKEIHSHTEDERKARDAETAKAEADLQHLAEVASAVRQQAILSQQLARAQTQLEVLKSANDATSDNLRDARGDLKATRAELSEQSAASLVTALANADMTVKYLTIIVPVTPRVEFSKHGVLDEQIRGLLLPTFSNLECQNNVILDVIVVVPPNLNEKVTYNPGDNAGNHRYFKDSIPKIDLVGRLDAGVSDYIYGSEDYSPEQLKERYPDGVIFPSSAYHIQLKPPVHSITASSAYSVYSDSHLRLVQIRAFWQPSSIRIRQACSEQLRNYFRKAFDKAVLIVTLDGKQGETIIFHLNALPPISRFTDSFYKGIWENPIWDVPFALSGTPEFITMKADQGMVKDWPDSQEQNSPR